MTKQEQQKAIIAMVVELKEWGLSPDDISSLVDQRVNHRTIRRWQDKTSVPANTSVLEILTRKHKILKKQRTQMIANGNIK